LELFGCPGRAVDRLSVLGRGQSKAQKIGPGKSSDRRGLSRKMRYGSHFDLLRQSRDPAGRSTLREQRHQLGRCFSKVVWINCRKLLLFGALNFLLDEIRRLQKEMCDILELSEEP